MRPLEFASVQDCCFGLGPRVYDLSGLAFSITSSATEREQGIFSLNFTKRGSHQLLFE